MSVSNALSKPQRIKQMLNPESVVFIGGSNLVPAIDYTRSKGYQGSIHVINPYHDEIAGIACLKAVDQLPEIPDLGFVSVPKEYVIENVRSLAQFGVVGTICNSAGFSELKDDGIDREAELIEATGEMPMLGPNCPGFVNFVDNAAFMQDHFGDHDKVEQGVAIISNGGAYISDMCCARRSLSVAYAIGVGNQAMLSIGDMLDVVLDDPRVRAVNLYIESFHDVPALSRAALKAVRKNIPIVVVKGGLTEVGERAAQTHTASIAGDNVVASALFERFGFIEAANPVQAIETLKMLTCTKRPQGPRVAFLTSSGSYAVLGGDAAQRTGLEIPPMPKRIIEAIKPQIPHFVLPSNPLDIAEAQFEGNDVHQNIFRTFLTGDQYDLALLVMSFPPPDGWISESWYRTAENFAQVCQQLDIPCAFINTVPEDLTQDARKQMVKRGLTPLMGIDHGMQAIGDAVRAQHTQKSLSQLDDDEILLPQYSRNVGNARSFDESTAKKMLATHGVSIPESCVVRCSDDVSQQLQYPVVVKALSEDLLHKTELGAVELNVRNTQDLEKALTTMKQRIDADVPELNVSEFLVEQMINDAVAELMVGIRYVEDIGMTLTLAVGGVAVELLKDAVTVLLPASRQTISEALKKLKLYPLLNGWRGKPVADIEAALDQIEAMIEFAIVNASQLETLEVNPLLVCKQGKGAYAVDAVLTMRQDNE